MSGRQSAGKKMLNNRKDPWNQLILHDLGYCQLKANKPEENHQTWWDKTMEKMVGAVATPTVQFHPCPRGLRPTGVHKSQGSLPSLCWLRQFLSFSFTSPPLSSPSLYFPSLPSPLHSLSHSVNRTSVDFHSVCVSFSF